MLEITSLERQFSFKDKEQNIILADPSPSFTPEAVINFYAQTYPLLTTAKIEGPQIRDDKVCYTFVSVMGTKG